MSGIGDVTMDTIETALGGLAARSAARADNLANANTPGFKASTVEFEEALAQALGSGDPTSAPAPVTTPAPGVPDETGNTVSLETEMVGGVKDGLLYSTLVRGYDFKLGVLRSAIGGQQ
jgi:flagellar basal-body rod protein FlgB